MDIYSKVLCPNFYFQIILSLVKFSDDNDKIKQTLCLYTTSNFINKYNNTYRIFQLIFLLLIWKILDHELKINVMVIYIEWTA